MPNLPYGNAFIIQTPKSDRLVQQIAQDQRQRELYEQQQSRLLDQEFSKNVSNIRDIDIGDAVKKYQQYKNIGQELYKNGNRVSNTERISRQLDKQRAASEYYSLINKSKELKEPEEMVQKSYFKDPSKFEETTPDYLMISRKTPVLQHPGPSDIMSNTQLKTRDFSKQVVAALGKSEERGEPLEEKLDNGLTTRVTKWKAYNSPNTFANNLGVGISSARDRNAFVNQFGMPDDRAYKIMQDYATLKETPAFKKAYPNEPEFTPEMMQDPFSKTVALKSMENAILHPPSAVVKNPYNNTGAVMDRKDATWLAHNAITDAEKRKAAALLSANKDRRLKEMQSYGVSDPYEEATKNPIKFNYPNGETKELYKITGMSPTSKEDLLGKGTGGQKYQNYPIEIGGEQYLQKGKDGELLNDEGEPIDRDQPFINRVKRVGRVTKLQKKGELEKTTSGNKTLAERMKAAIGQ